ncbi:hypothetical protein M409DRAFT_20532 [Zasmidium cellare ATCC 36951]|uniref:FAD-binding domain-containing protein n=1 Tax=Zasmidium cellare ATCC 36951 TaxID=1080233 RepID=A0A6A6CUY3_ZASCE|nr:uncharacterized protein M409DRAFT_20532 [Zasmidium cellare ATCC 36951]KAF2169306.1 hypothetical protein M409DRAFT_20532 [Zasmidium cellare ATCC 36951]
MSNANNAVIGAGLTFARLLQQNGISVTVYEAESDRHSRNQGGSLDLHPKYGQKALSEAGLLNEFRKIARPEGECIKLIDKDGNVLADENVDGNRRPADDTDKPEVDRTALRDLLLDSLKPDTVQWGCRVDHIEEAANGTHDVHFTNGAVTTGITLLIGADGAFSKVRPLVTDVEPFYSGITMVTQWVMDASTKKPWLDRYVGAGSLMMFDEGRLLICQRQSGDSIRTYASPRKPLSWTKESGIDWNDYTAVRKAFAEDYFGNCGDDVKRVLNECDDDAHLDMRHLYMLPIGLTWSSKPSVTLLGDAAHLMTPFGGVGVNAAMADSLYLAKALITQKSNLHTQEGISRAIEAYEQDMFPRAEFFAKKTYDGLEHHFRATGGQEWSEKFKKRNS